MEPTRRAVICHPDDSLFGEKGNANLIFVYVVLFRSQQNNKLIQDGMVIGLLFGVDREAKAINGVSNTAGIELSEFHALSMPRFADYLKAF